jgi:hypothetical protein
MHNGKFWAQRFKHDFIPATHRVADVFLNRLMPTFSTAESEAEALTQELWDNAMSSQYDPYGPDESEIAEAVQEAGIEHYLSIKGMEQGLLNCCALFLYHLFEQHLMFFHRKELLGWTEQNDLELLNHKEVHKRLEASGVVARSFLTWPKLEELRRLANTLKHGEGKSSRELAACAPGLFRPPGLKQSDLYEHVGHERVYTPLLGEGVFVTVSHIHEYAKAIEEFWNELSTSLDGI